MPRNARRVRSLMIAAVLAASMASTPSASALQFHLIDLNTLYGLPLSVQSINDAGQIAGYYTVNNAPPAHSVILNGGMVTQLGALVPGEEVAAFSISNSGMAVGQAASPGYGYLHAFLYDGSIHDLGTLPGGDNPPNYGGSQAAGVNASGQVVGSSFKAGGGYQYGFVYSGGVMTNIGTLGGIYSAANAINDSGVAVGYAAVPTGKFHAVRYSGGELTDLGLLPGTQNSNAQDINASGQIVGFSDLGGAGNSAFLYSGGVMTDIGPFVDFSDSFQAIKLSINDAGQIVGGKYGYAAGGKATLNSLLGPSGAGWNVFDARDINNNGWIIGRAIAPGNPNQTSPLGRSVLLIPVPEPSSTALAALGASAAAVCASRRRAGPCLARLAWARSK